ncbi:GDSL esterase/lipase At4g10955-like isoform X1 [Phragmites australis]|uniref:GDSL esterase/lipase At4g10955-like isoform X1 n=1 Tax=Phragmites australis TaxID=29695 RepID=UPI002D79501B|nr:GDSL esterase/lipase At4g10955-like isoform X1 [Phragmites australis]
MGSGNDFAVSGPMHMMARSRVGSSPATTIEIDWDNEEHRRCITSCLVKGTYVLQSDQTRGEALAPAWWESFHFNLLEALECEIPNFLGPNRLFSAFFEYVPPYGGRRHKSAPRYIVAFRGTMLNDPTALRDMCHNASIVLNQHHNFNRFRKARERVEELIANGSVTGSSDVWLAGHSLGASIALDVGHEMARKGCYLPTFLFNPPHVSLAPAVDVLPMTEVAKEHLSATSCVVKYVLGKTVLRTHGERMEALFEKLSPWEPNLYVHERDVICKGFIDYFDQRKQVQKRFPGVAMSATTLSYRDMCYSVFGKQSERAHLLPSAWLHKNSSSHGNAHELQQWWHPGLTFNSELYSWH